MARAAINQGWQLGVEASAGAGGAANKKLQAYSLEPGPEIETSQFTPRGYKVPTVSQLVSEHMGADYDGLIDYRNIVYVFSSLFGPVTPTQPDGTLSPTVYLWTWNLDGKSKTTPKSYAVEFGESGAGNANSFTHGVFTSAELEIGRTSENTISGEMIGQELTTGVALTAAPTEIEVEPVNGSHWDIYMADAGADLALTPTQLEAIYAASLNFGDLFVPEWAINSSEPSFKSLVEAEDQTYEWEMTIGADAVANAMLTTTARQSAKKFFRMKATGDVIEDALNYELIFDFCTVVTDADSFQSNDGLYVLPVSYNLAYDGTWGKFASISVQTDIASL
jgi:hypothetical protein